MAITELAAIEAAYQALQPLSPGARRRAVRWLSDALETEDDLLLPDSAASGVPAGATDSAVPAAPAVGAGGFDTTHAESPASGVILPVPAEAGPGSDGTGPGGSSVSVPSQGRGGRPRRAAGRGGSGEPVRGGAKAAVVPPRQRRRASRPDNDRAYRRMPTADEVMAAYRTVGTVTGLADHFGVPTHTVQGWARRLRGQGYQIGRGSREG